MNIDVGLKINTQDIWHVFIHKSVPIFACMSICIHMNMRMNTNKQITAEAHAYIHRHISLHTYISVVCLSRSYVKV